MKSKLDTLKDEKQQLAVRIAELEEEQKRLRAEMAADPLKSARALAPKFSEIGIEIDVLKEALGKTIEKLRAEETRINSTEVQNGIKRAEKLLAENRELRVKIGGQVSEIVSQINGATAKANEAAQLLKIGGQDDTAANGGMLELGQLGQLLNGWLMSGKQQAVFTANVKQAEANRKAREEARAKEAAQAETNRKAKAKAEAERDAARSQTGALGWLNIK